MLPVQACEGGGGVGGSPFWPLSAAYQESERKAHKQKSSSVRKVPLRSLISPGARRAPAGPRPHGPGDRGRGAGAGRRRGAPAPDRGGAVGPEEVATSWTGMRTSGSRAGCSFAARGAGGLGRRLGRGRAGLGQGGKSRGPAGSGTAAESTAKGGAAGI